MIPYDTEAVRLRLMQLTETDLDISPELQSGGTTFLDAGQPRSADVEGIDDILRALTAVRPFAPHHDLGFLWALGDYEDRSPDRLVCFLVPPGTDVTGGYVPLPAGLAVTVFLSNARFLVGSSTDVDLALSVLEYVSLALAQASDQDFTA